MGERPPARPSAADRAGLEGRLLPFSLEAQPATHRTHVGAHPLDQCRDFFRKHRNMEPVAFYDTAGSVKHVIEKKMKDAAGIAAKEAARVAAE